MRNDSDPHGNTKCTNCKNRGGIRVTGISTWECIHCKKGFICDEEGKEMSMARG